LIAPLGGDEALILIDRIWLHERTGAVALESMKAAGRGVLAPQQAFCTMDHIVDTYPGRGDKTLMPTGADFITATRAAARDASITLFDIGDARQGITHVISPEQGVVLPGLTLICPDSHTSTQGAFGALAWGVGSSDAEHALATSTLRVAKPETMRIKIDGVLGRGVTAKDLALYILAKLSSGGGKGRVIEYCGEAISDRGPHDPLQYGDGVGRVHRDHRA
jgi:3-isopropylmalate/(R)-2-methylmalate dehydratase large subunit